MKIGFITNHAKYAQVCDRLKISTHTATTIDDIISIIVGSTVTYFSIATADHSNKKVINLMFEVLAEQREQINIKYPLVLGEQQVISILISMLLGVYGNTIAQKIYFNKVLFKCIHTYLEQCAVTSMRKTIIKKQKPIMRTIDQCPDDIIMPNVRIRRDDISEFSDISNILLSPETNFDITGQTINQLVYNFPTLCILSILEIAPDDIVGVMGAEQYNIIDDSTITKYVSPYDDMTPLASDGTITRAIVFMNTVSVAKPATVHEYIADEMMTLWSIGMKMFAHANIRLQVATTCPTRYNSDVAFVRAWIAAATTNTTLLFCTANAKNIIKFISHVHTHEYTAIDIADAFIKSTAEIRRESLNNYCTIDISKFDIIDEMLKILAM